MLCKIWKGTFNELAIPVSSLKLLTNLELQGNKRMFAPEVLRLQTFPNIDDFYRFFCLCPSEHSFSSTLLKCMKVGSYVIPVIDGLLYGENHAVLVYLNKIINYVFTSSLSFLLCSVIIHHFSNPPSWKKYQVLKKLTLQREEM